MFSALWRNPIGALSALLQWIGWSRGFVTQMDQWWTLTFFCVENAKQFLIKQCTKTTQKRTRTGFPTFLKGVFNEFILELHFIILFRMFCFGKCGQCQCRSMKLLTWWRHQMFSALLAICEGIPRSPVNSPDKGQWHGTLVFSLIWAWVNGWVNNREAGDLRRHRAHYDVTVMNRCKNNA